MKFYGIIVVVAFLAFSNAKSFGVDEAKSSDEEKRFFGNLLKQPIILAAKAFLKEAIGLVCQGDLAVTVEPIRKACECVQFANDLDELVQGLNLGDEEAPEKRSFNVAALLTLARFKVNLGCKMAEPYMQSNKVIKSGCHCLKQL